MRISSKTNQSKSLHLDPAGNKLTSQAFSDFSKSEDSSLHEENIKGKLVVKDRGESHFINKSDIIHAEAMGAYTDIYLTDSRKIMISKNLKTLANKLDDVQFLRTHKSHLVNAKYILKYVNSNGGHLVMENGINIPISVRKKEVISTLIEKLVV